MGIGNADSWRADLSHVLLTEDQIRARVKELAAEIGRDYAAKNPLLVGVLKGSIVFLADLIRAMDFPLEIDLLCVSSYGHGAVSSGAVTLLKDLSQDVTDRDLILVEDIIDTGLTLSHLRDILANRGVASLAICCLLNKPSRRQTPLQVDYIGFDIDDEFVVGYGLDYAERFRGLPFIAVIKPEAYQK